MRNFDTEIKKACDEVEKKALAQIQSKAKEIAKAWVKGEIIVREQAQLKADQELKQRIEAEKELRITISRLSKIEEQLKFENQTRKTAESQSEEFKKAFSTQQQKLEILNALLNQTKAEAAENISKIKSQLEDKAAQYAQSILKIQSQAAQNIAGKGKMPVAEFYTYKRNKRKRRKKEISEIRKESSIAGPEKWLHF